MSDWTGVSVKTRPAEQPVTIEDVKARLRVDFDDDDQVIAKLIAGAVARIDGPDGIGVAMMQQTWRKSMDCFPCTIRLPGWPVKDVTSITYVDQDGTTQTLAPAAYRVDYDSEPVRIEPAYGTSWPVTRAVAGAVKVEYQLGEASADNVPADLIDAVCMLVAHRYENREAVLVGVAAQLLPMGVEHILAQYSRAHVA